MLEYKKKRKKIINSRPKEQSKTARMTTSSFGMFCPLAFDSDHPMNMMTRKFMTAMDRPSMKADELRYGLCTYVEGSNVVQSKFCECPPPAVPAGAWLSFAETFMGALSSHRMRLIHAVSCACLIYGGKM